MILQYYVFFLLLSTWSAYGYDNCKGAQSPNSVTVSNCTDGKDCVLKKETTVIIQIEFTAQASSKTLTAEVHGILYTFPVPFPIPNANACNDSGIVCPIEEGKTYTYKSSIYVEPIYPNVPVDVQWELIGDDGFIYACVIVPSKIKH